MAIALEAYYACPPSNRLDPPLTKAHRALKSNDWQKRSGVSEPFFHSISGTCRGRKHLKAHCHETRMMLEYGNIQGHYETTMKGSEVYKMLMSKGIGHLYHANSLTTSISQLKLRGLASRKLVEDSGLPQTYQYTDSTDKQLGVWGDIFLDTVDIHKRASRLNYYGPILFILDIGIIQCVDNVLITKSNPSKWGLHTSFEDRYFTTYEELVSGWEYGNFDQMLTIRNPATPLKFDGYLDQILIDEPGTANDPSKEFSLALSAISCLTNTPLSRRQCPQWCKCKEGYTNTHRLAQMYSLC